MLRRRLRAVLAALWLGGLASTGLIGASTAFQVVPQVMLAAAVASTQFERMALAGLGLGALLLMLERGREHSGAPTCRLLLVLGGLMFDVVGQFGVVPRLLQAAAEQSAQLGWWHALASTVYALQALCVLAYVWLLAGMRDEPSAHPDHGV